MKHTDDSKLIQVFEHELLLVGDHRAGVVFQDKHWIALQAYQKQHAALCYTIVHKGVRFNSFVGILALPDLVIEVLPKADAYEQTPGIWRRWLVSMLQECRLVTPYASAPTGVQLQQQHLLDVWIQQFLEATEKLLHQGLQKKYTPAESSQTVLRGKILFSKNIQQGIVHKEKLYTRYQDYNNQHLLHFALWQALDAVTRLPCAVALQEKARALQPFFPENQQPHMASQLSRFRYDRQTMRYKPALSLAYLLLHHFSPNLQTGGHAALALMVDMNRLYEEYIYRKLKSACHDKGYNLQRQVSAPFWNRSSLRPDLVLHTPSEVIVLDTKWKMLGSRQPPEEDLKQMYVYNHHFQAQRGILLYPKVSDAQQSFSSAYHHPVSNPLFCEVVFVPMMTADKSLNKSIGKDLLKQLGI